MRSVQETAAGALLERGTELDALERALDATLERRGRALLLEGPAGIGKTELLRAGLDLARARGLSCAVARGSEFERDAAFGVVRQLLEPLVGRLDPASRERAFSGAARLAEAPLSGAPSPAETSEGGFAVLHGLYWLVVNLSDLAPVVLAVDDLPWADASSSRWLAFLARRLEGLPILLVATARSGDAAEPDVAADALEIRALAEVRRPAALGPGAVASLVRDALDAEPDDAFAQACLDATRGNPLMLRELLGDLRSRGTVPDRPSADGVRAIGPATLGRQTLARLTTLGAVPDRLARAAAVLGDGADAEAVREVADVAPGEALAATRRLAEADVVRLEPVVSFHHPVVRAAIVASLDAEDRGRLGRAAAVASERRGDAEATAHHLLAVRAAGDPWVVTRLMEAAARAQARGAPEVAVALLERARAEPPGDDVHADVLHALGVAEMRLRASTAPLHLAAALERTPPGAERARRAEDLAHALQNLNRSSEAVAVAEAELPGAEGLGRERLAARIVEAARYTPSYRSVVLRNAEVIDAIADRRLRARVDATRAYDAMLACEPADRVAAAARRALAEGALTEDTTDGSQPVFLACMALAAAGDQAGAADALERVVETARRRGSVTSYCGALSVRARIRLGRGDLRGAEADAREIQELGDPALARHYVVAWLVESLVAQGRLAEAQAAVEDGPLAGDVPTLMVLYPGLHARGVLRIAQGRLQEGLADVLECGERQEAEGLRNPADVPWRASAALALHALGRRDEALAHLVEHERRAREFGAAHVVGAAERVRGELVGGDDGLALLRDAAERLAATGADLERARTGLALGRALAAAGAPEAARAPLAQARATAEACGAAPVASAAIEALLAAGGRPRRGRALGRDALTPAERRTAEEAARGRSNREIAQALFITEKTVEAHLSRAYRKLGIASRSQIAPALEAADT